MKIETVTPAIMCKNEDFWIYYSLRDMVKVFGTAIVLDTGSTDETVNIIKREFPQVTLIEENYGNDANKIGNGRNVLRSMIDTKWLMLWDADEIWNERNIRKILEFEPKDTTDVIMVLGWNVQDCDGVLKVRTNDKANRDGLFSKNIKWTRTDYPFESYGLQDTYLPEGKVEYIPWDDAYAWHMRHTLRSSKNWEAYFRKDKINYYTYGDKPGQTFEDMPEGWLGEINPNIYNPYLL